MDYCSCWWLVRPSRFGNIGVTPLLGFLLVKCLRRVFYGPPCRFGPPPLGGGTQMWENSTGVFPPPGGGGAAACGGGSLTQAFCPGLPASSGLPRRSSRP